MKCAGLFQGKKDDGGEVRVTFLFLLFSQSPSLYGIQYAKMSYFEAICLDHHQYIHYGHLFLVHSYYFIIPLLQKVTLTQSVPYK